MAALRLSSAIAVAAAAASLSTLSTRAYADAPFRFPSFYSYAPPSPSPSQQRNEDAPPDAASPAKPEPPEEPRGAGFDPEALEREAKALREINGSPHANRQRKLAEEQKNLVQQQALAKAQMLRNEDELARKRMQVQ